VIRVWTEQTRLGNLTQLEVAALLGADDPKSLARARAKLEASEMVMLVWTYPPPHPYRVGQDGGE